MHRLNSVCRQMVRLASVAGASFVVTVGHVPAAWAQGQIFATSYTGDSITVYSRNAAGDVAPTYTIPGQIGDGPHQIAINRRAGELVVANNLAYSVTVYDAATGAPKRTIAGPSTGLNRPTGVAVDEVNGEIYVANDYGESVTVYDILATGNASPKRIIQSHAFGGPVGLAIDLKNDEIVVASQGNRTIATFDRLATGPFPKRAINGVTTGLVLPQGIALDSVNNEILVANSDFFTPNAGAILVFPRTGDGDVAPIRRLEGSATGVCNPMAVALDRATDEIVVANSNFGSGTCAQSITTYSRTATGNAVPKRTIAGALTALSHPTSAAITSASSVGVKVKAIQSSVRVGEPVSYSITAVANGGPVFNVALADTLPAGLAWALSGTDSSSCALSQTDGKLACSFGNLAKGQTKAIQVSAISGTNSCPGIANQAAVSYNDGTADVTGVSTVTNISIKCR
jgi:DNA-binding beta-propeller fold protein YncE